MSQVPPTPPTPQTPPTQGGPVGAGDPMPVRIALLVSAIFNILSAVGWAFTCFGIIISIPLVVLAIFEFMLFGKLGAPPYAPHRGRAQVLGILEICTLLVGNLPSMVCGILVLVFLDKLKD